MDTTRKHLQQGAVLVSEVLRCKLLRHVRQLRGNVTSMLQSWDTAAMYTALSAFQHTLSHIHHGHMNTRFSRWRPVSVQQEPEKQGPEAVPWATVAAVSIDASVDGLLIGLAFTASPVLPAPPPGRIASYHQNPLWDASSSTPSPPHPPPHTGATHATHQRDPAPPLPPWQNGAVVRQQGQAQMLRVTQNDPSPRHQCTRTQTHACTHTHTHLACTPETGVRAPMVSTPAAPGWTLFCLRGC